MVDTTERVKSIVVSSQRLHPPRQITASRRMCTRIDRNHEENPDGSLLFVGPEIMQSVQHYVPDGDDDRSQSVADGKGEEVEGGR
jgi:hypothetical protein